jgi:hypothetical protein
VKDVPLHLNKLESPLHDFCQVWLKLAQWFWRRSRKCKSLQTDGRYDGQPAIRKAHFELEQLSAQVSQKGGWKEKQTQRNETID